VSRICGEQVVFLSGSTVAIYRGRTKENAHGITYYVRS
jgi:hypothetical protein